MVAAPRRRRSSILGSARNLLLLLLFLNAKYYQRDVNAFTVSFSMVTSRSARFRQSVVFSSRIPQLPKTGPRRIQEPHPTRRAGPQNASDAAHHTIKTHRSITSTALLAKITPGDDKNNDNNLTEKVASSRWKRPTKKKIAWSLLAAILCGVGVGQRRELWLFCSSFINMNQLNESLRNFLDKFNQAGNAGLVLYALLFCLWTMTIGVTTPVETAAGFVFGARRAIPMNFVGKLGGAVTAFLLGRFIFYETVRDRLKDNEMLQLVEESIADHPLLVAVMVRLLPLPEVVKNLGMSVLHVKSRYFVLSVLLHGVPFTCLWSCMGAETAQSLLKGSSPSTTLKLLVTGSTWFGTSFSMCARFSFRYECMLCSRVIHDGAFISLGGLLFFSLLVFHSNFCFLFQTKVWSCHQP